MMSYIQLRGKCYYARLGVPRDLRAHFKKREFKQSLKTNNIDIAKPKAMLLVNHWKHQFKELQGSSKAHLQQASQTKIELSDQIQTLPTTDETSGSCYIEHLADSPKMDDKQKDFYETMPGKKTPFLLYKESFFNQWQVHEKTKQMADTVLKRVCVIFPTIESVKRGLVMSVVKGDPSAPKTKQKNYGFVHKYWEYLKDIEAISCSSGDPFSKLKIIAKHNISHRKEFSVEEIKKLYISAQEKNDEELADLIFFAMHTGARIEELCQLKTIDILQINGYSCIQIKDAKASAGNRTIPIHSSLRSLIGKKMNQRNDGYLIAMQNKNKFGNRSNALSKRFTRLKQGLGFSPEYVFHSIRKTVVTIFQNNSINEGIARDIIGHDKKLIVHGLYSGQNSVESKFKAIEKIKFQLLTN